MITVTILCPIRHKPRWILNIIPHKDGFKVEESTRYSLFNSDLWEAGNTPGQALDNFLKVEESLINGLMSDT